MLGRAVDEQAAVLLRQSHRDLALEVELVLPADANAPALTVRRILERLVRVATHERLARHNERLSLYGFQRIEHGLEFLVNATREARRLARSIDCFRRDCEYRLPGVLHERVGEHGIVAHDRAVVVVAGNVGRRAHGDDTCRIQHVVEVEFLDACVRDGTHADGEMQEVARFRQIVGVGRRATNVQVCAVVRQRLADGPSAHSRTPFPAPRRWSRARSAAAGFARRRAACRPTRACR